MANGQRCRWASRRSHRRPRRHPQRSAREGRERSRGMSKRNVYVASSWRNRYQPEVVQQLRGLDLEVYDFRNPRPGDDGFRWSEIDPDWQNWTPEQYVAALSHPIAEAGFKSDMDALRCADATLLVLPSGRSAHLELGYAVGAGQRTAIYIPERQEPDLMAEMVDELILYEAWLVNRGHTLANACCLSRQGHDWTCRLNERTGALA